MKVYKYRGGSFKRDLESLERNYFWAPKSDNLNDPCETLINTTPFKNQSKIISKLFGTYKYKQFLKVETAVNDLFEIRKKMVGIYSLSKTFKDELLWAHYANSHYGFCVEYDLDLLINSYEKFKNFSFPINYSKKPPEFTISDLNEKNSSKIIQKMAGFKSKRWSYEKEHRIVTDFYGEQPYRPKSVKGIYFGLNMLENEKREMIKRLKGRCIQFYQIIQLKNSYEFDAIKLNNLENETFTYLKEIPPEITGNRAIKFNMQINEYWREIKADIDIELYEKVSNECLEWLAKTLREQMFRKPKRVFIKYFIKDKITDYAWATTHYEEDKFEIKHNNFE